MKKVYLLLRCTRGQEPCAYGEEKAKKLVESVFGLSPLIYIGGKNQ